MFELSFIFFIKLKTSLIWSLWRSFCLSEMALFCLNTQTSTLFLDLNCSVGQVCDFSSPHFFIFSRVFSLCSWLCWTSILRECFLFYPKPSRNEEISQWIAPQSLSPSFLAMLIEFLWIWETVHHFLFTSSSLVALTNKISSLQSI